MSILESELYKLLNAHGLSPVTPSLHGWEAFSMPGTLTQPLEIVYNLDMEHDIYWSKQRRDLIEYIIRIQVVYDMSCGTMSYIQWIVHLDIVNMFRTITYDV